MTSTRGTIATHLITIIRFIIVGLISAHAIICWTFTGNVTTLDRAPTGPLPFNLGEIVLACFGPFLLQKQA